MPAYTIHNKSKKKIISEMTFVIESAVELHYIDLFMRKPRKYINDLDGLWIASTVFWNLKYIELKYFNLVILYKVCIVELK